MPYGTEYRIEERTPHMGNPSRTLVATGVSRGFGLAAAEHLLRTWPDIHLLVTARGAGQALTSRLADRTGNANVTLVHCDMSSLSSVRSAAAHIASLVDDGAVPPVHGLLANAGVQTPNRTSTTADGFESTFGVNVLANYLLIRLLEPHLAAPARIIVTSSDSHFGDFRHNMGMIAGPRWEHPDRLARPAADARAATMREGGVAYSTSKLGVEYLVHAFARRLPPGVDIYSYTPSLVPGTGLMRDNGRLVRMAWGALMPALTVTPWATSKEKAGRLLAEAVAGPRPGDSGSYIERGVVTPSSAESYAEGREEDLWNTAAALTGLLAG